MYPIFSDYIELLNDARRDERTLTNNTQAFDRFSNWCRKRGIDPLLVTQADMRRYVQYLVNNGRKTGGPLKVSTVKRHLIAIRAAYAYARALGLISHDPTAGLTKLLPRVPDKEPEILTPDEQRRVLDHFTRGRDREPLSWYLLNLSGLRRSEALDLRWQPTETFPSYVDFDGEQFVILGKSGKHRRVPMHPILRDILTRHRLTPRGAHSDYVIVSEWNQKLSARTFNEDFRALYQRAELDWVEKPIHIVRKTLSTNLTRQGVRPDVIDAIFGWSAQNVRSRYYTGRVTQDMRDAIELAYLDDPVFPEQPRPEDLAAEQEQAVSAEMALVRLKLELAERERENLEMAMRLEAARTGSVTEVAA